MTQQRCYYHPLRRIRTRYSVGAKIFLLLWAAGLGGTLYSLYSVLAYWHLWGKDAFRSFVPQELYQRSSQLYQPVLSAMLPASEQKRSYAINCGTGHRVSWYRQGDLPNALKCGSDFIGITHSWWCCASHPFSATRCEYFWRSQKPEVTETRNVSRACHQYCKCLWWVFRAETCRNFASYGQLLCLYERGE